MGAAAALPLLPPAVKLRSCCAEGADCHRLGIELWPQPCRNGVTASARATSLSDANCLLVMLLPELLYRRGAALPLLAAPEQAAALLLKVSQHRMVCEDLRADMAPTSHQAVAAVGTASTQTTWTVTRLTKARPAPMLVSSAQATSLRAVSCWLFHAEPGNSAAATELRSRPCKA